MTREPLILAATHFETFIAHRDIERNRVGDHSPDRTKTFCRQENDEHDSAPWCSLTGVSEHHGENSPTWSLIDPFTHEGD